MTEKSSARFADIDVWSTLAAMEAMYEGQLDALASLRDQIETMAAASDAAAAKLKEGGRLVYVGAGTSGRLAVMDGVELSPTFGWPEDRLLFCVAGGMEALMSSAEGAEDAEDDGARQLREANINSKDVVLALAASGETPFTLGALRAAAESGALTIGVSNNPGTPVLELAQFGILAETGSEPVAGSTRMKAGTAQKVILSLLSTAIMLRLDRVYRGFMVNMIVSNDKLEKRAVGMISAISDCSEAAASDALAKSDRDIKTAILVCLGQSVSRSREILARVDGSLRRALAEIGRSIDS